MSASDTQDQTLARLLFRFQAASWKLDLARDHWPDPSMIVGEDMGAITVVREVAGEISSLYCLIQGWARASGHETSFDGITTFDHVLGAAEPEAQS